MNELAKREDDLRYEDLLQFGDEMLLDGDEMPLFSFSISKFTPVIVNQNERNFYVDFGDTTISNQDFKEVCKLAKDFNVDGRGFEIARSSVKSALFFYWL